MLLNACKERIPFNTMRSILKDKKLPTHAGWDKTISTYLDKAQNDTKFAQSVIQLKDSYINHLLSGEKFTSIFKFKDIIKQDISAFINNFKLPKASNTPYANSFPFLRTDLKNLDDQLYLTYADEKNGTLCLGYCSTRKVEEHVKIQLSKLSTSIQSSAHFSGMTELFGTKKRKRQLIDFVFINLNQGYIEFRIDASSNLSVNEQLKSFRKIKIKVFDLLKANSIKTEHILAHNMFPKIDELYDAEEGRVCELAFTVDTGGTFHEKVRNKDIDIRSEDFHCAGMDAVDKINAYKIAIEWSKACNYGHEHKVELYLSSTIREVGNPVPSQYDAHILKCFKVEHYDDILNKLL